MNYLSHFYTHQKHNKPYYNTGLVLPDLARGFVKSFKEPIYNTGSYEQTDLFLGCKAHYFADKKFHSSNFFKQLVELVSQEIAQAGFSESFTRKWFLAHVMAELMLDRILVKQHPELVTQFYQSLRECSIQELKNFTETYHVVNFNLFAQHFNHFIGVAYVQFYPNNIKFVFSLNRIMAKVNIPTLDSHNELVMLNLIDIIEEKVKKRFASVNVLLMNIVNEFE